MLVSSDLPKGAAGPVQPESLGRGRASTVGLVCALVVAALAWAVAPPSGLSPEGTRLAALFLIAITLWVTEAIPIAITALLVVLLQPVFGIVDLRTAIAGFISPVFFFVLAMFCIAQVVMDSGLSVRFALWLIARAGTDSRRLVLAFMVGTGAMSTVVSDVPTTAIWMSMALGLLAKIGASPGSSALGKALMIGIPIASLVGGVGTPAGSPINILGIYLIEQYGKVRVPFLSWTAIGIPMVALLIPVSWWAILRCYPPELALVASPDEVAAERRALGRLSASEKKVLSLFAAMLVLWILSTWIPQIDTTAVALAGAIAVFLPGMNLLTWSQAERGIGWDSLFIIGGVTSLGEACVKTGLAAWLVNVWLPAMHDWHAAAVVALISLFTVLIHLPLPIAPVVNAVLIPPVALLATATGHNPVMYTLPIAFTASCGFLLPLDANSVLTYSKGYYRMVDMLVPGAIISACWIVLMTVLTVWFAPLIGLF